MEKKESAGFFCRTSDRFALAPATLATHSNKSTAGLDKRTRNPPTPTAVKGPTSEMRKTSQTRNLTTGRLTTPQFFCTFPIHINWSKIAPYKIVSWILRTSLSQWFGSFLNPNATPGDDTSAKMSLRPPFTSPVQLHLIILAFLGLKGFYVLLTLCSSAFCH